MVFLEQEYCKSCGRPRWTPEGGDWFFGLHDVCGECRIEGRKSSIVISVDTLNENLNNVKVKIVSTEKENTFSPE
jgi:hypothetical protein